MLQHLTDPGYALEPPVAKQLRIIVRGDQAVFTGGIVIVTEQFLDQRRKVQRM